MAVVIETTLGDITVDLYYEQRPVTCLNFLKLCKMKYYNYNLFHTIRSGFIAQTGDPTGEGAGGESIFGLLEGPNKRFFSGERMPKIRHTDTGMISMVGTGDMMIGSQFFFTLGSDLDSLDGVHCVIGEVTEGHEVLRKLNEVICDETHRPYQDVRITHTVVLEDPYNDPTGLQAPSRSPSPSAELLKGGRIAPDEDIDETQGRTADEIQEMIEEKEAKARATILEIVGDLPDADMAPPENVLFVCKLNPVTTDEDLEIIFSRFGKIVNCEVIRDRKTGDSLQYAFIEFTDKKSCEDAYFKMDNVLIDDRRIHVDFSQSVSKIKWLGKGRGVKHMDENESARDNDVNLPKEKRKQRRSQDRSNYSDKRSQDQDRHYRNNVHKTNRHGSEKCDKTYKHEKEMDHRPRERSNSRDRRDHFKEVQRKRGTDKKHENTSKNKSKYSERRDSEHKLSNTNKERSKNSPKSPKHRHIRHRSVSPLKTSNVIHKESSKKDQNKGSEKKNRHEERSERSDKNNTNSRNNSERKEKTKEEKKGVHSKNDSISTKKNEKDSSVSRKNEAGKGKHSESNKIIKETSVTSHKNDCTGRNDIRVKNLKVDSNENRNTAKKRKIDDSNSTVIKTGSTETSENAPAAKTPPRITKGSKKDKSKVTKVSQKKTKILKNSKKTLKKRKRSTSSSDSDSSDSSTSTSDSSSSSDSDVRKKIVQKKKRRRCSSSSSSSSDSTSTSSTSSSSSSDSSSSSSDSDSDHKRKHKRPNPSKKLNSKSKKK